MKDRTYVVEMGILVNHIYLLMWMSVVRHAKNSLLTMDLRKLLSWPIEMRFGRIAIYGSTYLTINSTAKIVLIIDKRLIEIKILRHINKVISISGGNKSHINWFDV